MKERVEKYIKINIMKFVKFSIIALVIITGACKNNSNSRGGEQQILAQTPPMGWNSFDSYGVYLHEEAAMANLEAFAEKLKPHGYEYYVIDAGWFGEFELRPGTIYPAEKHAKKMNFNEYGLLQPSETYFPNGLQPIIDRCHELGLKFGLHLMRGIPREVVRRNLPIKGTNYTAAEIADTTSICRWNDQNYGVDMSKPGAQEFYNSLINQMAEWEVDFIKYDDLVPFPEEIKGIAKAIENCGRPIVYSLSPGGDVDPDHVDAFKTAHMLRVTPDIWDEQLGIDQCFASWRKWTGKEKPGFWIDMDMIPFGKLQLMNPKPEGIKGHESKGELMKMMDAGELEKMELLSGKGFTRWSEFTKDQMFTFITLRALSASPLMMGGDLPTLDDFSLKLITDKNVLECNQNGIMGHLVHEGDGIEIWNTPKKNSKDGWIGIFNRTDSIITVSPEKSNLGFNNESQYELRDVWNEMKVTTLDFEINPHGVVFLAYAQK